MNFSSFSVHVPFIHRRYHGTMPKHPLLSVVIPAKDERGNIGSLLVETAAALAPLGAFEMIVVDDGSEDGTCDEVLAVATHLGCPTTCIQHNACYGQSAALRTGARAARGKWILTLDGDGQNDPADATRMVERARLMHSDNFCIAGHRQRRRDRAWVRLQSRVANRVRAALLGDGVPDSGCGIKLFSRDSFLDLPFFNHFHRFLPALILAQGGTLEVIPVSHRERRSGQSKYNAWNRAWAGMLDLLGVAWLQRRMKRPMVKQVKSSRAKKNEAMA